MATYAKATTVTVARSRAEIESTVEKYGADQFFSGWDSDSAFVAFRIHGRQIKMVVPMPQETDEGIRMWRHSSGRMVERPASERKSQLAQAQRTRWRALLLNIKAKLEAAESGISTIEREFLAHIMLPDGNTVGDWAEPQLRATYDSGDMPPMIAGPRS